MFTLGHARCLGTIFIFIFSWNVHGQDFVPGEVIVKLKFNKGSMSSYSFLGKAQTEKQMILEASYGKMNLHHFKLQKGQSVQQAVYELSQDPDVEYVEPNYYVDKTNEVGFGDSFSLAEVEAYAAQYNEVLATDANIGLQEVWAASQEDGYSSSSSSKPIVAVIDTGLDVNHEVFRQTNSLWINPGEIANNGVDDDGNGYVDDIYGWNFVSNSGHMLDDDGHGTHVSGIILSVDQNIYSSARHDSKIQIMPLKFLDNKGRGTTSAAIQAIYYAVNNGAVVLNNSWGGTGYSSALHDAIAYSYEKGVSFVAAAGNAGSNNDQTPLFPASYNVPNVISVAATEHTNYLARFSNFGASTVHLGSPGVSILSTIPGDGFGNSSGTSMAAPFVAGTAAQMKVVRPDMLGYQIKTLILQRIQYFGQLNGKVSTAGSLNSMWAVSAASGAAIESAQPPYKVGYHSVDRGVASQGMGGCGTVQKLGAYTSKNSRPLTQIFLTLGLLLLPLALYQAKRMFNPESRRRHERYKINSEVRISVGDRELVGSVSSISLGGAQVNTTALLEDGGMVTMLIESPDGSEKVEVGGRVVWSEANKAYGVAFDQAPQSVLHRITDWTRGLQKT